MFHLAVAKDRREAVRLPMQKGGDARTKGTFRRKVVLGHIDTVEIMCG